MTWVDEVLSSASYLALRDKLVKAKWRRYRRLWDRLAVTKDDLAGLVDEHVFRVLSKRDAPPENVVNFLSVVIDRKLRDERRKGKRRIEAEQFIEDGNVDPDGNEQQPTKAGNDYHFDLAADVKPTLLALTVKVGGEDALRCLLSPAHEPTPAERKRASRFYIALAAELGWTTEQARGWVADLVDLFVSQRSPSTVRGDANS